MEYRRKKACHKFPQHIMRMGALIFLVIVSLIIGTGPSYAVMDDGEGSALDGTGGDTALSDSSLTDEVLVDVALMGVASTDCGSVDKASVDAHTSGEGVLSFLATAQSVVESVSTIVAGVGLVMGCRYIRSLREKANSAIFTYWSQISIRLTQIKNAIDADKRLINNLYPEQERQEWEGSVVSSEKIQSFYKLASDTMDFLKKAPDQMPAYAGWNKDYTTIITFLLDIIQYDIREADKYFILHQGSANEDRNRRCNEVSCALSTILNNIQERQSATEKRMYRYEKFWRKLMDKVTCTGIWKKLNKDASK